jgi:hypothetical protein
MASAASAINPSGDRSCNTRSSPPYRLIPASEVRAQRTIGRLVGPELHVFETSRAPAGAPLRQRCFEVLEPRRASGGGIGFEDRAGFPFFETHRPGKRKLNLIASEQMNENDLVLTRAQCGERVADLRAMLEAIVSTIVISRVVPLGLGTDAFRDAMAAVSSRALSGQRPTGSRFSSACTIRSNGWRR